MMHTPIRSILAVAIGIVTLWLLLLPWRGELVVQAQSQVQSQPPAARTTVTTSSTTTPPTMALPSPSGKLDKPTTEVPLEGCVTDQCHVDVKSSRVLHGPVHVNACDACHVLTSATEHTYTLTRKPQELCGFCHEVQMPADQVIHQPLTEGDCLSCHDPHGGFDRNIVRGGSMNALCATCHEDVTKDKKYVHGPVAAQACGACHAPHASPNEKLLVETGQKLCLSCHQEMGEQIISAAYRHEPVTEGKCLDCHDAHASDHAMVTKADPMTLCTESCHENVRVAVTSAKYKHSAVTQDNACSNCHTAHAGDMAGLMRGRAVDLCLKCHNEPLTTDTGHVVAAVTEILDDQLVKHGPVSEGSCGGCHNVHGSDVSRLLAKPYTERFYEGFAIEKYELCFACHDQQVVLEPKTRTLTRFRDADVNLHFVHVNKDHRGRTCRACHDTHASKHAMHVRESVPFGNWQLPIAYKPQDNGGSCSPGCHQPLDYDRTRLTPAIPAPGSTSPPRVQGAINTPANAPARSPTNANPTRDLKHVVN